MNLEKNTAAFSDPDSVSPDELFYQISQHVREVFWLSKPGASRIYYVSPAYKEIFGRPGEELYEDPMAFMKYVVPEDVPILEEQIQRGFTQEGESRFEFRTRRPDDTIAWVEVSVFPIRDSQGTVV